METPCVCSGMSPLFLLVKMSLCLKLKSYACVEFTTMHRSINHGGVELGAPRIVGADDSIFLLVVGEVFAPHVNGPLADILGDLRTELVEGVVAFVP